MSRRWAGLFLAALVVSGCESEQAPTPAPTPEAPKRWTWQCEGTSGWSTPALICALHDTATDKNYLWVGSGAHASAIVEIK